MIRKIGYLTETKSSQPVSIIRKYGYLTDTRQYLWCTQNTAYHSIQIEWNMIVVTVYRLFMNINFNYDHIPINLKRIWNIFISTEKSIPDSCKIKPSLDCNDRFQIDLTANVIIPFGAKFNRKSVNTI